MTGNAFRGHPFHAANNINGVNGDTDGDGYGLETHYQTSGSRIAYQKAYVRKVVDTVNDLDNVLYEISNEDPACAESWQRWR
jgi:hypothetical protein